MELEPIRATTTIQSCSYTMSIQDSKPAQRASDAQLQGLLLEAKTGSNSALGRALEVCRPRMLRPGNRSSLVPCRSPRVYVLIRGGIRRTAQNVRAYSPQLERAGGKTRGSIAPPDFRLRSASAWHTRPARGIPLVHRGRRHAG